MTPSEMLVHLISELYAHQTAAQLFKRDNPGKPLRELRVDFIDAVFWAGKGKRKKRIGSLGVIHALDSLATGTHHFEEFSIDDADSVTLENC